MKTNITYQWDEYLKDGTYVQIRPISLDDMEREKSFTENLSPKTKHERFFGGFSQLSLKQLRYFCDVDFDKHVAFVATISNADEVIQIGVARYVANSSGSEAELAITVADEWQNKGLGTLLMRHIINYARKRGVRLLYSYELAENRNMLTLVKKFGFLVQRDNSYRGQLLCTLSLIDNVAHVDANQMNQTKLALST